MHRIVPQIIIDNYHAGKFSGEFRAVGLFLDLSGFSTMTDTLMQHGQHGAEVLAGLMHGVFDPLVEGIFEYGGKVVGFAGDGIMALFPVGADEQGVTMRALAAAWEIQQSLAENPGRQTPYGKFQFSVKVGVAVGDVAWGILRSQSGDAATYFFRGSAVDESAVAEHQANAGEILFTDATFQLLRGMVQAQPAGRFHRFNGFRSEMPAPDPTIFPQVDVEVSRVFIPEEIVTQDVRGEFRQVVNLFMRFPEMADEKLAEFIRIVFELRDKYGGLLNRLDFGDKGCNMLVLWGAPTAYENDIGRALNFGLELQSRVDFPITMGVTYYIAHAGYLGSVMSEEYTCYGWGVNLAARFMMTAPPGQIWVDERIARRVSAWFDIEFRGSQRFKGFAAEQRVHVLHGYKAKADTIYQGEMIGRDVEISALTEFAAPLWRGEFAGLFLILGEAGIGKGRLLHELRARVLNEKQPVLWALCQSDQILRQSFNPIRHWLVHYFGVNASQSEAGRRRKFDEKLDELIDSIPDQDLAIELDRLRSMLAALVDVYWEGSLYDQFDAQSRYNSTLLALIVLIEAESGRQPVIVAIEDAHVMDEDTFAFLPRLRRVLANQKSPRAVAIVVTSRLQGNWVNADETLVNDAILLRGLSEESVSRMVEVLLGGDASDRLVKLVMERSEGNPYFVEQIVHYLQEENLIESSSGGWTQVQRARDIFLPGDIRALLVSRLDQLALEVKEVVQTASVFGREFDGNVLGLMLGDTQAVYRRLLEAEQHAIWSRQVNDRYLFTHGLLRDAAYTMQMRARRQELHRLAAEALESYLGEHIRSHYAEVAYHAERAEIKPKAQKFYILAGGASAESYQNRQAIEYFTKAFSFTAFDDFNTQFEILRKREELHSRIGDRSAQAQDLDSLEKIARQLRDDRRLASALTLFARYCFTVGDYSSTIATAERVLAIANKLNAPEMALGVYVVWSQAYFRKGQHAEATRYANEGLDLARTVQNRIEEGRALTSLGLITLESKEANRAVAYLEEALAIARETHDRALESRALGNLANAAAYVLRDYATARAYYEQACRLNVEMGDRYGEGIAVGNIGWACAMLGDFDSARSRHFESLAIAREIGNINQETYALMNLSGVAEAQGQSHEALQFALQANELARQKSDKTGEAWSYHYLGYAYLCGGDFENARTAFEHSLHMRREQRQPAQANEALAGLIQVALGGNDISLASQHAEEVLKYLAEGGSLEGSEEPLRVYLACYRVLEDKKDRRAEALLAAAHGLLDEQVSKLNDERSRRMFLESVPWRREIHRRWQEKTEPS